MQVDFRQEEYWEEVNEASIDDFGIPVPAVMEVIINRFAPEDECPDCGENNRINEGTECPNCGHAFNEELPEWMTETCEHGLSLWLCEGPWHYSDEF